MGSEMSRANAVPIAGQKYRVPLDAIRNSDGLPLAAAASAGEFGLVVAGWGAGGELLVGEDSNNNTKTSDATFTFPVPPDFYAGTGEAIGAARSLVLKVRARVSAVRATSCTLDAEVYDSNDEGGVGADRNATAAQNINATGWATVSYTITLGSIEPGDALTVALRAVNNDSGGSSNGRVEIGAVWFEATTLM